MRSVLSTLLAIAVVACSGTADRSDPAAGDATRLAGTWELRLAERGASDARGTITLAPTTPHTTTGSKASEPGRLSGTFALSELGSMPRSPVDSTADAFMGDDGRVILTLHVAGNCSDCGNLNLTGKLDADVVQGRWSREYVGDEPGGSFQLQRVP
jgi:hypothetical protein